MILLKNLIKFRHFLKFYKKKNNLISLQKSKFKLLFKIKKKKNPFTSIFYKYKIFFKKKIQFYKLKDILLKNKNFIQIIRKNNLLNIDYLNIKFISKFLHKRGTIKSHRYTFLKKRIQKHIAKNIKKAKNLKLLKNKFIFNLRNENTRI